MTIHVTSAIPVAHRIALSLTGRNPGIGAPRRSMHTIVRLFVLYILRDMQAIMLSSPGNLARVEEGRGEIDKRRGEQVGCCAVLHPRY